MKRAVLCTTIALFLAPMHPAPAQAADDEKPATKPASLASKTWRGSVDDEALQDKQPKNDYVADEKTWEALRKAWNLGDETKDVDFKKSLVLVGTTRGSRIMGEPTLTAKGDLKFMPISTRDLRPGFRYLLCVVPREGVKTINGKPFKD